MSKLSKKKSIRSSVKAKRPLRPARPAVKRPLPRPKRPMRAPVPKPAVPKARPPRPQRPLPPRAFARPMAAGFVRPSMSRPSHFDEEQMRQLESLYSRWEQIAEHLTLSEVADRLEDVDSAIVTLPTKIASLRERGYIFNATWEEQAEALLQQWESRRDTVFHQFEMQSMRLQQEAEQVSRLLDEAARNARQLPVADRRLDALERLASEAKAAIYGSYDQVEQTLAKLRREMSEAEFLLDVMGSASFPMLPEEHGVAAVKAEWLVQGGEPMKGILILTDSRLIFEQREEVVKKKVLFFATEKETIQKLQWQAPIGAVQVVGVQDKGGFLKRHQELMTLRMEGGDAPPQVTLNLRGGTNERWSALIRQVQAGEIKPITAQSAEGDEAAEADEGEPTQPTAAPSDALPTTCPNCGAPLPPIYKGMHQVTCEYCGAVIRL